MADFLKDIKIVDLRRSVVNEEKSDRKKMRLVFDKKTYVVTADYKDAHVRPPYKFEWGAKDKDGYGVLTYQHMGYEFVTPEDDFWPEGAILDAENHYVFKDAILMKCPLDVWLKRRARDIDKSNRGPKAVKESFLAGLHDDQDTRDFAARLSDEEIQRLIG